MNKNSLTDRYVIFSFNGEGTTGHGSAQNRKNHILAASRFLELLTNGILEEKDGEYALGKNPQAAECFASIFPEMTGFFPLQDWMDAIAGLSGKICAGMREKILSALIKAGELDIIPSLLEADSEYRLNGIKENAYRSDFTRFSREKTYLKNAILTNRLTDDDVCLIWLLLQDGEWAEIFLNEERNEFEETLKVLPAQSAFTGRLTACRLEAAPEKGLKRLFSNSNTQNKPDSVFIETETMFPDSAECITVVKSILESNGHICQVKSSGSVPVMAIDNVLYSLTPDAKRVRVINVHGVRLSRYRG